MASPRIVTLRLGNPPRDRLDKELSALVPAELGLSRSRIIALIKSGHVKSETGDVLDNPRAKPVPEMMVQLRLPEPVPIEAQAEDIPVHIVHEDEDVIVIDKQAGLVVHPGPGSETGTLVNALLHHCGDRLRGIGDALRPGIVHRIDKDTSGLLVVAKTDLAMTALAAQFAAHTVEREYAAFTHGVPSPADPRLLGLNAVTVQNGRFTVRSQIGRHPKDRKRMAVVKAGGKSAVTHFQIKRRFGDKAALVACRLETGRTHQIRVHMAHIGHPLIGDPVYGRARTGTKFPRQALHAALLGFQHPRSKKLVTFRSKLPSDIADLHETLANSP